MLEAAPAAQDGGLPSMKKHKLCSLCGLVPSKYSCPACATRTCSLECSKAHKASSGCSGKRRRTKFVDMGDFDDRKLLSDCGFLEDAGRALYCASRSDPGRSKNAWKARRRNLLPRYLVHLMKVAKKAGVDLQVMPVGMERRKINSTSWAAKGKIKWHVEWRFSCSGSVVSLYDKFVDDARVLGDVLKGHLSIDSAKKAQLFKVRNFLDVGLHELCVLMHNERRVSAADPEYLQVSLASTLKDILVGKKIVEFPIFSVFLTSEAPKANLENSSELKIEECPTDTALVKNAKDG